MDRYGYLIPRDPRYYLYQDIDNTGYLPVSIKNRSGIDKLSARYTIAIISYEITNHHAKSYRVFTTRILSTSVNPNRDSVVTELQRTIRNQQ